MARAVARSALSGYVSPLVGQATHYHTLWVAPYWSPSLDKVANIGAHTFYRWKGATGSPGAFTQAYAGAEPLTPLGGGYGADDTTAEALQAADAAVGIAPPAPVSMPQAPAAVDDQSMNPAARQALERPPAPPVAPPPASPRPSNTTSAAPPQAPVPAEATRPAPARRRLAVPQ